MIDPIHPKAVCWALFDDAICCRGITPGRIVKAARAKGYKINLSRVQRVLNGGTPNPGIRTVLAILAGMDRDLSWLHSEARKWSAELYGCDRAVPTPDDVPL